MIVIINHFPICPHNFFAEISKRASVYSTTVSQIFIFDSNLENFKCIHFSLLINKSLKNTIKFETEYSNSDIKEELLN